MGGMITRHLYRWERVLDGHQGVLKESVGVSGVSGFGLFTRG